MPKVLRIIDRLNLGGPTFNAALLTKHMSPEFETLLVSGTKQDSNQKADFDAREFGITFRTLTEFNKSINPINDYIAYRKLRKIIREFKPDIVHTHASKAGIIGRLAAFHEKVPVIVHTYHGLFHSYFNKLKNKIVLSIERYLAKKTAAIIAINNTQKNEFVYRYKICKPEKIKTIPLCLDLSRFNEDKPSKRAAFRSKYFLEEDELAVGLIGRLAPVKNQSLLLVAIPKILKKTNKNVRFFIIGDGEIRNSLIGEAKGLGIDTSYFPDENRKSVLTFCSWVKDVDVALSGLDIITLTSFKESTPVTLIEAQACNKPIVSTNVNGIENVVSKDETAILVESNNVDQFTDALIALIEDDDLRRNIGQNGWEIVKEKFHLTRLVANMTTLYHQLLKKQYGR